MQVKENQFMKTLKLFFVAPVFLMLVIIGCKDSSGRRRDTQVTPGLEQRRRDVVDFQILKDALPETLIGLKRTSHMGQKSSFSNMEVSNAQAQYSEGDKRINVTITDTGGVGMAMAGLAAWAEMDMRNETADGFERTTTLFGHKAFEKYNRKTEDAEIAVIYDKRFVITLNGHRLTLDELRNALPAIEIKG